MTKMQKLQAAYLAAKADYEPRHAESQRRQTAEVTMPADDAPQVEWDVAFKAGDRIIAETGVRPSLATLHEAEKQLIEWGRTRVRRFPGYRPEFDSLFDNAPAYSDVRAQLVALTMKLSH